MSCLELTELIARVEDAGITVAWTRLQHINAGWDHLKSTIWMDFGLYSTPRRAKCVLAHEWGHALLGHEGPQCTREEARADTVAAGILINPSEYAHAERLYGPDPHLLSLELGVTSKLVTSFQGVLARV